MAFVSEQHEIPRALGDRLLRQLRHCAPASGVFATPVHELTVLRFDTPAETANSFDTPAVSMVLQGGMRVACGAESLYCGEFTCLVNGLGILGAGSVVEAAPARPFLAVTLAAAPQAVAELSAQFPPQSTGLATGAGFSGAVSLAAAAPEVLDAFSRLLAALDSPEQTAVLAPMLMKEIYYRVLCGPQGACLSLLGKQDSHGSRIAAAVRLLRENFTAPLRVPELAADVDMAVTTFYRCFKLITGMSPVQFQKNLRLREAQRLMLAEAKDACGAALAVGYESPTQFNREYKRLFGEPPHRNIDRLRREQRG